MHLSHHQNTRGCFENSKWRAWDSNVLFPISDVRFEPKKNELPKPKRSKLINYW